MNDDEQKRGENPPVARPASEPQTGASIGVQEDLATRSISGDSDETALWPSGVQLRSLEGEAELPKFTGGDKKYKILETLGQGGMGTVYLAYDRDLRRQVALKRVRGEEDARKRRFIEEAQILGQLEHPNIVPLHEVGVTGDDQPYCTMRYLRGRSLHDILVQSGSGDHSGGREYSLTRLLQIWVQVAQAVSYAHARGVVHRDIKPHNIMLGDHGEVQLVDWGLAMVLDTSQVEGRTIETSGEEFRSEDLVAGSIGYMPPEQILTGQADERTDIHALGVVLYEILTGRRPYVGSDREEVIQALLHDQPLPLTGEGLDRSVPPELERVCLTALAKDPESRQQSVGELIDSVQGWLEAEADRSLRSQRADQFAMQGEDRLNRFRRLKKEQAGLAAEIAELRAKFMPWQPIEEKASLYRAEDRVAEVETELATAASDVVMTVAAAFGQEDAHPGARKVLADYFWDQFREAEVAQRPVDAATAGKLVAAFHDGRYERELKGDGSLSLRTQPVGAEVWLYEFAEEDLILRPTNGRLLGNTPIGPLSLPMGSYLVVLKKPGFAETKYPVFISRNREWDAQVRMFSPETIGQGFVHVPAGPFLQGGDPGAMGWCLPASEEETGNYFIGIHPVTLGEYLEFLNSVTVDSPEKALELAPRRAVGEPSFLVQGADGLLALPEPDDQTQPMLESFPLVGVTWHAAHVYCDWRAERDGRPYRLPTESEWEKAVRGVDGRGFAWGNRFDATLCNTAASRPGMPSIVSVDEYPTDVSVYGVRGMAGNTREWTSTTMTLGAGETAMESSAIRGGAFEFAGHSDLSVTSRCAFRFIVPTVYVNPAIGMRLIADPPSA